MSARSSVFDLEGSAAGIDRYWSALRTKGLARLGGELPAQAPERSYLWPHLCYAENPRAALSAMPLPDLLALEREEFSGFPMAAPGRFLLRFGVGDTPQVAYVPAEEVAGGPNESLKEALRLIDAFWPEAGVEIRAALLGVAWIASPDGGVVSGCGPKQFGLVNLNAGHFRGASAHQLSTALIHETAHHALFVETARDPLIPQDFAKMLWSPLRKEMRPAIGVLHAVFTVARIGQWAKRMREADPGPFVSAEIERLREKYFSGIRETMGHLKPLEFTPRGTRIFEEIWGSLDAWEALRG
jgi:hypothetical protein